MKSKILIVLSVFTGLLLLTNLFGWNTYLNFKLGSKDLIFGTTIGMAHVAFADHSEMHDQSNIWMNNGFISLYSEKPGAELKIFGMDIINDQGYFALEFSLLLMLQSQRF